MPSGAAGGARRLQQVEGAAAADQRERRDRLRLAVLEHREVLARQIGDEAAVLIARR